MNNRWLRICFSFFRLSFNLIPTLFRIVWFNSILCMFILVKSFKFSLTKVRKVFPRFSGPRLFFYPLWIDKIEKIILKSLFHFKFERFNISLQNLSIRKQFRMLSQSWSLIIFLIKLPKLYLISSTSLSDSTSHKNIV